MLPKVIALVSNVALAACSVVGVRQTEEPAYTVVDHVGRIELRHYGHRVAAETTLPGTEMQARSAGFRRLAAYIFGANTTEAKIAMTAPVAQSGGQTIAMTAPVGRAEQSDGGWTIRFFMPAGATLDRLPRPNDPAVRLLPVSDETVAVLRFSGGTDPRSIQTQQAALLDGVRSSAWKPTGGVVTWFYDPPWTLPPFRRTEVAVPVQGDNALDRRGPRPAGISASAATDRTDAPPTRPAD